MTRTQQGKSPLLHRVAILILALAAAGGWGAFAYATLTLTETEKKLQGQVASLQQYQAQYMAERRKAEDQSAQVVRLHEQLSSVQGELQRVTEGQRETEQRLAETRDELRMAQEVSRALGEQAKVALSNITPRPTERDIVAAQEALTELRFGNLKADGVIGPDTRKAVEEFQRAAGLTVTGELYAQTLQSLLRAARVVAAQKADGSGGAL